MIRRSPWPCAWNDFAFCASPSAKRKPGDVWPTDREPPTRLSPPLWLSASQRSGRYATSQVTSGGGEAIDGVLGETLVMLVVLTVCLGQAKR
jgi:hypothetical protein